jgi:hypothetical protein
MEIWRVVMEGQGGEGHTEAFVEVESFADVPNAVLLEIGLPKQVKLAQFVRRVDG